MRALYLTGDETTEMREAPPPVPDSGEVLVDVSRAGLCGSDMHFWHGHFKLRPLPIILGHEFTGTVVDGPGTGQRVAVNPMTTCETCTACTTGYRHLCAQRGLIGVHAEGGFAERVAVPERCLTPIPDTLAAEAAVLAEPLAVCVHTARVGLSRHTAPPGETRVTVLGGGAIGLLCAMAFREMGVAEVRLAEPNAGRRATASRVLAADVYDPVAMDPGAETADLVCDAVGSATTRAAAMRLVRPGGTIAHVGLQEADGGVDFLMLTRMEVTFVGTYCYNDDDFAEAVRLLAEGRVTPAGWTEVRPLTDGPQSFRDVHEGRAPPKIILVP